MADPAPVAGQVVEERLTGRIDRFVRNARGTGRGRLRYVRKLPGGTREVRGVDFDHGQCVGGDDLPLPAGVYPRVGEVVTFSIRRGASGRLYAADVQGANGQPLRTVGTPIDPVGDAMEGQGDAA